MHAVAVPTGVPLAATAGLRAAVGVTEAAGAWLLGSARVRGAARAAPPMLLAA